jgi:DNA repair photolyase
VIQGKQFPKDVVELWPEVFGEVALNVVPLVYVHTLKITFKNNKIWEIKTKQSAKNINWDDFETQLKVIVSEYESDIEQIDFKLDTDKIKKDITRQTKKFLNNKKLT